MFRQDLFRVCVFFLLPLSGQPLAAQGVTSPSEVCKPASMRTQQVGCWILAHDPIGQLMKSSVFWALDVYPTRAAAEADKGPRGRVLESLGKVWLLNIEYQKSQPSHGSRATEIGPLPVVAGENYSVQYMEAIFNPGMPEHLHSGPEAWYTLAGETCSRDLRWSRTSRPSWRPASDCSDGAVYASDRHGHGTTPLLGAHPSPDIAARKYVRP